LKSSTSEVIRKCNRIHHQLLKAYDPILYNHLAKNGIEPQIYGMYNFQIFFKKINNQSEQK